MHDNFPYAICCPSCSTILSRSLKGTRTFIHCSKCQAEIFYEVNDNGATVRITKEPKTDPRVPEIPA